MESPTTLESEETLGEMALMAGIRYTFPVWTKVSESQRQTADFTENRVMYDGH